MIDNGGGGIFDFLPQAGQVEPDALPAAVHDAVRARPRSGRGGLRPPLRRVVDEAGVSALADRDRVLAHVPIDRVGNVDLHRAIAAAVAASLG